MTHPVNSIWDRPDIRTIHSYKFPANDRSRLLPSLVEYFWAKPVFRQLNHTTSCTLNYTQPSWFFSQSKKQQMRTHLVNDRNNFARRSRCTRRLCRSDPRDQRVFPCWGRRTRMERRTLCHTARTRRTGEENTASKCSHSMETAGSARPCSAFCTRRFWGKFRSHKTLNDWFYSLTFSHHLPAPSNSHTCIRIYK